VNNVFTKHEIMFEKGLLTLKQTIMKKAGIGKASQKEA
jgi:hypothetical protein